MNGALLLRAGIYGKGALLVLMVLEWCCVCACATTETRTDAAAGAQPCNIAGKAHPYVLLSAERLRQLRVDSAPDGHLHDLYANGVKKSADHWLNENVSIPPRSGYWHDFVCTDGTRLRTPDPQRLITDLTSATKFTCPACGSEYSGPKIEGAFRAVEHAWLTQACLNLALAGAIEQRDDFRRKAAEILVGYADAYPGRHTDATHGGIFYQSLDESVNFIALAQAYDLICDTGVLTAAQRQHIGHDLFWEGAEGLVHGGIPGNWGSWHLSAVGVVGLATQHQRFIDYAIKSFKSQIAEQLGDDGLWPESVHTYHFYPMRGFLHLAEACANCGIDLYNWEARPGKGLKSMFTAPLDYMYPNFQLPAINDGWFASFLPLDIYQVGYERYRLPELGWAVRELERLGSAARTASPDVVDVWSLIHATQPTGEVAPIARATNFPVLGITCLRQPQDCTSEHPSASATDLMMTFDYGPHLGHGQFDKMGVTFFANGQLLSADYGTCSYGSKLMPYYKGTQSHNTIRFDGKDQPATKLGRLIGFRNTPCVKIACAETTEVCKGATWRRAVVLTPDYGLVLDNISADASHQYDCLLHAEGDDLEFPGESTSVTTNALGLSYFTEPRSITPQQYPRAMWKQGNQPLMCAEFLGTTGTQYFTARCPAEAATHMIPAVVLRTQGTVATFATLLYAKNSAMMLSSAGPKLVREPDGKLRVRGPHGATIEWTTNQLRVLWNADAAGAIPVDTPLCSTPQPIGQTGVYAVAFQPTSTP